LDFAIRLPPLLQSDLEHGKIFLRQASKSTLPEDVRWKPKDNSFDPLLYQGLAQGPQALTLLTALYDCPILAEVVDVAQVAACLHQHRQGQALDLETAQSLAAILQWVGWYQRVQGLQGLQ